MNFNITAVFFLTANQLKEKVITLTTTNTEEKLDLAVSMYPEVYDTAHEIDEKKQKTTRNEWQQSAAQINNKKVNN